MQARNLRIQAVLGASPAALAIAGLAGGGAGRASGGASTEAIGTTSARITPAVPRGSQSMPTAYRVVTVLPG